MKTTKSTLCGVGLALLLGGVFSLSTTASAQTQPTNTLSITSYGASTSSSDNTAAIQNCMNAAQSQGKGVWIPAGTWTITGSLNATGILIAGAGKTNSIIYRNQNSSSVVATQISSVSCTFQDLGIDGNGTARGVNASYGINMKGVGWLVQRVQIHHSDAGMWMSGANGTVDSCTMLQTFADGVNINNSSSSLNGAGANLTVQNTSQDGAGDDGIAINSQGNGSGWTNMLNPKVLNCTSINAFYANGIRVAGGQNSLVQNCWVSNTTHECGIENSSYGSGGYATTNGLITGNLVYGSGTADQASTMKSGDARTVCTYSGNTLINSADFGFQVGTPTYPNAGNIIVGPNNVIINPALSGIHIQSGVVGSGKFWTNTVEGLNSGQLAFVNGSSSFTATLVGNSWQVPGPVANGIYKLINLNSGLALDAYGQNTTNGTPIDQNAYQGTANEEWAVTNLGSSYQILGVQSGLALDVKGQGTADGTPVQLYSYNGGGNQQWVIAATSGGYFTVQGVQSGKPMEVSNSATTNGALVDISSSTGGNNQQWSFQSITPSLTITANNASTVYGAALPGLSASYSGFVNGDTTNSLTTQPTLSTTATSASPVGAYPITASGAVDTNYTISYVPGTLTVTAAPLTITANNASMVYGAALPPLSASYSGFVNGDTTNNLTTQVTLSTTATASSPVGTYPITASGAVGTNYTISYVAGTLTITTAPLTITANNAGKVYGAALPAFSASYSGFVNGDTSNSLTTQPTLSTTATAASPVGTYPITASGAVDANYTISYVAGILTVSTAPLTITANNASKVYGAALPAFSASYSGFVNGNTTNNLTTQPTLSTTATASSPIGTYPITASGASDTNYTISYVGGTLTVKAPVASGIYKIINLNSGLALDAKGQHTTNGTPIQQYTYNGGANQQWGITNNAIGQYVITGVQSGRVLDVKGQSTANGAIIQLYDNNGGSNQMWTLTAASGGTNYTLQGVQSGKLMEVSGSATTNGAPVDQWSSTGGNNQQWSFQTP